jgi:hypothetical protein
MSKKNSIKLGRQPPDEAALVVAFGVKIRMNRWGMGIIGCILLSLFVCACVVGTFLLVWMTPEQAADILKVISGK